VNCEEDFHSFFSSSSFCYIFIVTLLFVYLIFDNDGPTHLICLVFANILISILIF
jgi:hypothetical protein